MLARRPPQIDPFLPQGDAPPVEPGVAEIGALDPEALARAEMQENEDGTLDVDLDPPDLSLGDPLDHDANLAEFIDDSDLSRLAGELKEAIEADKTSRSDWEKSYTKGMTQLGLKVEDRTYPFKGAAGGFDSTMLDATIRFQATARGEFLPNSGPVKTRVVGKEDEEISERATRIQEWMNLYLTRYAKEYYPDRDQMFLWLPVVGSMFTKTYFDPVLGRPTQPYITPDKFVVNFAATDLDTVSRATHLYGSTKRDTLLRQQMGYWRDVELGLPSQVSERSQTEQKVDQIEGRTPSIYDGDYEYKMAECHCNIDLDDYLKGTQLEPSDGVPLPYIVTFEYETAKVLAIRRNWKQGDERKEKRRYFTHHKFLPGFGFYGLGYAHVLSSPAQTLTAIQRQVVDAGTLAMFPGGLRAKGMRLEETTLRIGPCDFPEIDLGGASRIQDAIMPLPYKGADPNSIAFYDKLKGQAEKLANTTEIAVGEGRQDAPVGTTLALLEAAMRPQSGIFKRLHESLTEEFALLAGLFGEVLPETPYPFPIEGGEAAIMRSDFDGRIDVIPVSDPNISSQAQRIMRAEAVMRIGQTNPGVVDGRESVKRMFTEMGIRDTDKLVPSPPPPNPPMDPASENVAALKGLQLTVGFEQDDDAHIQTHQPILALPQAVPGAPAPGAPPAQNPLASMLTAHIEEHKANRARKLAFQMIGAPPVPPGQPLPPEIENMIAEVSAQFVQMDAQQAAQGAAQANQGAVAAMMAEVSAKMEATKSKERIEAQKAAVERYKADLEAESKRQQNDTKLKLAVLKETANLAKPPPQPKMFPMRQPTSQRAGIGSAP